MSEPFESRDNLESPESDRPWQIQLFDSIWLLAGAAIVFFVLSYIVWGLVDILTIPTGG